MKGPLANLMQQAQRMQEDLKRAQEEVGRLEATGQAGGGMVRVTVNGHHQIKSVKIDPTLIGGDVEMLEDLVVAAGNDAQQKINEQVQKHMAGVTGGMQLPPGFKMPF